MANEYRTFQSETAFRLEGGSEIAPLHVAYETWGVLNEAKNNAILICHALTGDQYVTGINPVTKRNGWWSDVVGKGKLINTDKYFVICSNVIGGCMGSSGPTDKNDAGDEIALDFPIITIGDMVRAQALLIEHLGIEKLFAVIGGSMGGMQVQKWMSDFPERIFCAVPIATSSRNSAQNIAFYEVGRQAIMADPEWKNGYYHKNNTFPSSGLAVARMAAHITYMSDVALHKKFGRNLQDRKDFTFGFDADFQIESYLRYQGNSFVDRFDANSYLYVTRAMDYFDLASSFGGNLVDAYKNFKGRACVVSFSSDWHYPPAESRNMVRAMMAAGVHVSALEVETDKGHDAFLLDEPVFHSALRGFLDSSAKLFGIDGNE